jgi:hypothetical protein
VRATNGNFADASIAAAVAYRDRFWQASLPWGSGYGPRTIGRSRARRIRRLALVFDPLRDVPDATQAPAAGE